MSLLPVRPNRVVDPTFRDEFRAVIARELEEILTRPGDYGPEADEIFKQFVNGGWLPRHDKTIMGRFIRCCQEIRLTPDEIWTLTCLWFE